MYNYITFKNRTIMIRHCRGIDSGVSKARSTYSFKIQMVDENIVAMSWIRVLQAFYTFYFRKSVVIYVLTTNWFILVCHLKLAMLYSHKHFRPDNLKSKCTSLVLNTLYVLLKCLHMVFRVVLLYDSTNYTLNGFSSYVKHAHALELCLLCSVTYVTP